MDSGRDLHPDTLLQHYGEDEKLHGAVIPPLFQNSLFVFDKYDDFVAGFSSAESGPPYIYSRISNPTLDLVERKIAKLEGADEAKVFGGGMGAIYAAVMSCIHGGSHVVAVDTCYYPVRTLLSDYLKRFGVTVDFVDGRNAENILDAIRPETSLVYLENPTSFLFRLQDVEAVTKVCREKGIPTILDNTYATPLYQNPIKMGVDLVVHSGTKYLSGHSDVTAGVVCGSKQRLDAMLLNEVNYFGSILSPFGAWLLLRGMRTLKVRIKAHEEAALSIAGWLEDMPQVEQVFHPGLPSFPQRDLFQRQFRGSTGLFAFEPKCQDLDKLKRFVDELKFFGLGVSWGGFESLVMLLPIHAIDWPEPKHLIRLHIGLEDVDDLKADLSRAFEEAGI